jgi:hypothetical protein
MNTARMRRSWRAVAIVSIAVLLLGATHAARSHGTRPTTARAGGDNPSG